jgi:hypothetical protein
VTATSPLHHRDRAVIDLIYHHPVAHNLPWRDVVTLFGHIGKAVQKHDGKWLLELNGQERTFHTPHGEHVEPGEVVKLRDFLSEAGMLTNARGEPYLDGQHSAPVKMVIIDHHAAVIYDLRDGECVQIATVHPHDPHHFLHHLTHRDQSREHGQRAPEDASFYESLISALQGAEVAVLIGTATGASAAIDVLAKWLRAQHGRAPGRVVEITHTNTSAFTIPELAQLARAALRERTATG